MALQSKMLVYAAIAGLLALMGAFVWYASLDNPELEKVEISLSNVEVIDVNKIENTARLEITFLIKNPSEKTFTVPVISYKLFVDGNFLGSGQYSTEDIAMPGRAVFYQGSEIPLKNILLITKSDVNSEIYQSVIEEKTTKFEAAGIITTETSWSMIEKEFTSST